MYNHAMTSASPFRVTDKPAEPALTRKASKKIIHRSAKAEARAIIRHALLAGHCDQTDTSLSPASARATTEESRRSEPRELHLRLDEVREQGPGFQQAHRRPVNATEHGGRGA
jgi:hypothetical protein